MASDKVIACCEALIKKKLTIKFAESASAGKLSYEFSTVFNSGKILIGGIVCYNIAMKEELLQVPIEIINKYTPESATVTKLMAENFHDMINSDICVALTGLTTPGGSENSSKPVGTIFIHIIFPESEVSKRFEFNGDQESILNQAIDGVARIILENI